MTTLSGVPTYPTTINDWVTQVVEIERDLAQLKGNPRPTRTSTSAASAATSGRDPNAMEVDKLSPTERLRRRSLGLCFYCGTAGHRNRDCPQKGKPTPARVAAANEAGGDSSPTPASATPAATSAPPATAAAPAPPAAAAAGPSTAPLEVNALQGSGSAQAALAQLLQWAQAQQPQGF